MALVLTVSGSWTDLCLLVLTVSGSWTDLCLLVLTVSGSWTDLCLLVLTVSGSYDTWMEDMEVDADPEPVLEPSGPWEVGSL